ALKVAFAEAGLPLQNPIAYKGAVLHDDGLGDDAARDGVYTAAVEADAPAGKAGGQKGVGLNSNTPNSAAYREALQALTESVVKAGAGQAFGRASGSELIRIRTNEIAL